MCRLSDRAGSTYALLCGNLATPIVICQVKFRFRGEMGELAKMMAGTSSAFAALMEFGLYRNVRYALVSAYGSAPAFGSIDMCLNARTAALSVWTASANLRLRIDRFLETCQQTSRWYGYWTRDMPLQASGAEKGLGDLSILFIAQKSLSARELHAIFAIEQELNRR